MHSGRGIGINNLQKSSLEAFLIPVPPLLEQSRIVARVQELMAVLDHLEERLATRDKVAILASESIVKMYNAETRKYS